MKLDQFPINSTDIRFIDSDDLEENSASISILPADICQALLDVQPNMVHYSGHGHQLVRYILKIGQEKLI